MSLELKTCELSTENDLNFICIILYQATSATFSHFFNNLFLGHSASKKGSYNSKAKSWQEMLTREINMNPLLDDILMHLNFHGFVIVIKTIGRNMK